MKIPKSGGAIFADIRYIDKFPEKDSLAFVDPSDGGDYTAMSIITGLMDGVAVEGYAWKTSWYQSVDEWLPILKARKVRKLVFETNSTGSQPIVQLRSLLGPHGIGVVGVFSDTNKHAVIQSAGSYSNLIHLSRESDPVYTKQVTKYEKGASYDDCPDSLARGLEQMGLIRGKK